MRRGKYHVLHQIFERYGYTSRPANSATREPKCARGGAATVVYIYIYVQRIPQGCYDNIRTPHNIKYYVYYIFAIGAAAVRISLLVFNVRTYLLVYI